MSKRDWKLFLIDIMESIQKIENYIGKMSHKEFLEDSKTRDAVVRNLEIIGEAVVKIPLDVRQKYTSIPWS